MNNKIIYGIITLLALSIGYQLYKYYKGEDESETIPNNIIIETVNGKNIPLSSEINGDDQLIVILFKTECDFCKSEIINLHSLVNEFKNTRLIFLSKENIEVIKKFRDVNFPTEEEFVIFGRAKEFDMDKLANNDLAFPYNLWYDKNGNLKTRHKGVVSASRIVELTSKE